MSNIIPYLLNETGFIMHKNKIAAISIKSIIETKTTLDFPQHYFEYDVVIIGETQPVSDILKTYRLTHQLIFKTREDLINSL